MCLQELKLLHFCAMSVRGCVGFLFLLINTKAPSLLAKEQKILYQFLLNKWYFDEIYEAIIVKPIKFISKAFLATWRRFYYKWKHPRTRNDSYTKICLFNKQSSIWFCISLCSCNDNWLFFDFINFCFLPC